MPRVRAPRLHAQRLLRLILKHSRVSRSELTAQTGYSTFLVSKLCDRLIEDGFIAEVGSGSSTGGRPPMLLSIRPGLGRVAGLHVGTVNARVAVSDLSGNLLGYEKVPSRVSEGPATALPHLIELIERMLAKSSVRTRDLDGIGIGISGILDKITGTTLMWPKMPQWLNVPVQKTFADWFRTYVRVEDTPRTMALAERHLGAARDARDFIYLMFGAGVGAALFWQGQLYTGADGFAGEFGHMSVDDSGPPCACGSRGCLESFVSASALIAKARYAVSHGLSSQLWSLCQGSPECITIELIAQAADLGDRFALRLLHECGERIGQSMANLIHLLNPGHIVMGGGLMLAAGTRLLPAIRQTLEQRVLPRLLQPVSIELSALGEREWARGASLLVAEPVLDRLFLSGPGAGKPARGKKASRE